MSKWSGKSRGGGIGYKLFFLFLKYGGLFVAYTVLRFVALYFVISAPKAVKNLYKYFRQVHSYSPLKSSISVYLNFVELGESIIDRMAVIMGMVDKFSFNFEDEPILRKTVESDDGCLMVSAHVGNWQVAQAFLHRFNKKKVNIVMVDVESEKIKQFVKSSQGGGNVNVIIMKEGLDYLFDLVNAFRNREVICLHGDRFVEGSKVCEVEFFSKKAQFPLGPFSLAKKFKVPVSFTFVMKTGRTEYSFYATEGKIYDNESAMVKDYATALENIMQKYPLQWFNYHDFWVEK
jgi:predicted LPLAT superfamily acyltransferase